MPGSQLPPVPGPSARPTSGDGRQETAGTATGRDSPRSGAGPWPRPPGGPTGCRDPTAPPPGGCRRPWSGPACRCGWPTAPSRWPCARPRIRSHRLDGSARPSVLHAPVRHARRSPGPSRFAWPAPCAGGPPGCRGRPTAASAAEAKRQSAVRSWTPVPGLRERSMSTHGADYSAHARAWRMGYSSYLSFFGLKVICIRARVGTEPTILTRRAKLRRLTLLNVGRSCGRRWAPSKAMA